MKDLTVLKYFLGIEVSRNKDGIYLFKKKYALNLMSEYGILVLKPINSPTEQNHGLACDTSELLTDQHVYRWLVGRLVYWAITLPELSYAIHKLAQFLQ